MQPRFNRRMRDQLDTLGQRLRAARRHCGLTQVQLAKLAEVQQSDVSKVERGASGTTRGIARLARALGVDALWLERGVGSRPKWADLGHTDEGVFPTTTSGSGSAARFSVEDAPSLSWGDVVVAVDLPAVFWTQLPDDSMAPRAPRGRRVCFDSSLPPRPGDGVLVMDSDGAAHFRLYRAGSGGRWTAEAINVAFAPLDSERDGLRVVAVLMAEEGRWS